MNTFKIISLGPGVAAVEDRETGRDLGSVHAIDWPISERGQVRTECRWEARRSHEALTVNAFGFPTFGTRREAAAHLADVR